MDIPFKFFMSRFGPAYDINGFLWLLVQLFLKMQAYLHGLDNIGLHFDNNGH
jgi:hypothetical protein